MHKLPLQTVPHEDPSLPNQPFFSWLRTQTGLFIGQFLALFAVVSSVAALIYYVKGSVHDAGPIDPDSIRAFVVYAHLGFFVICIMWLIRGLDIQSAGRYRAGLAYERLTNKRLPTRKHAALIKLSTRQERRFKILFLAFWCSMLALYVALAIQPIFERPFSRATTLTILDAASIRTSETLKSENKSARHGTATATSSSWTLTQKTERLFFPFLSFALNNLSLLLIFYCFVSLYLPAYRKPLAAELARHRRCRRKLLGTVYAFARRIGGAQNNLKQRQQRLIVWFTSLVVVLTLLFPLLVISGRPVFSDDNWREYPAIFDALSGTLSAIVFALLIARLDSKLISLPSWQIGVLYFYACVQPLYLAFDQATPVFRIIGTAVLIVVFIFKIYFFLIIVYTVDNGRLFNYFVCSHFLNDLVNGLDRAREGPVPNQPRARNRTDGEAVSDPGETAPGGAAPHNWLLDKLKIRFRSIVEGVPDPRKRVRAIHRPRHDRILLILTYIVGLVGFSYFAGSLLLYAVRHGSAQPGIGTAGIRVVTGWANVTLIVGMITYLGCTYFGEMKGEKVRDKKREKSPDEKDDNQAVSIETTLTTPNHGRTRVSTPLFNPSKLQLKQNRIQISKFKKYFLLFWVAMLAFYGVFLYQEYQPPFVWESSATTIASISEVQPQLTIAVAIDIAESTSTWGTGLPVQAELGIGHGARSAQADLVQRSSVILNGFFAFALNNATLLCIFICFSVLYVPAGQEDFNRRYALLRNYSILIVFLFTVSFFLPVVFLGSFTRTNVIAYFTIFDGIGGLLNAIGIALLIARLNSRLIRLPTLLISFLYSYAALQVFFVIFEMEPPVFRAIKTSVVFAALCFKVCLFLIVVHVWRSGYLKDHLLAFPFLNKRVNSIFDNQFEIRVHRTEKLFTFSIFKENEEIYKTEKTWDTRTEVDEIIGVVRERMALEGRYELRNKHGTYWLEVKVDDEFSCESIGLRSEDDARDLKEESIEKVPYCKYNRG